MWKSEEIFNTLRADNHRVGLLTGDIPQKKRLQTSNYLGYVLSATLIKITFCKKSVRISRRPDRIRWVGGKIWTNWNICRRSKKKKKSIFFCEKISFFNGKFQKC